MPPEIVFATCRHKHDSYCDWRTLIETSGKPWVYYEEIDLSRNAVYVCTPIDGSFRPAIAHQKWLHGENSPGKVIWWNLERPVTGELDPNGVHAGIDTLPGYVDKCWVSDRYFLSLIQAKNPAEAHKWAFVPLGSSAKLRAPGSDLEKKYLWAHLSYVNGRRSEIIARLTAAVGPPAPNAFPPERDAILKQTRIMVNLHQDEYPIMEPLRVAVAAAYKMALISEPWKDPWPLELFGPSHGLPSDLLAVVRNLPAAELGGMLLYAKLCVEYEFAKNVERAVEEQFA